MFTMVILCFYIFEDGLTEKFIPLKPGTRSKPLKKICHLSTQICTVTRLFRADDSLQLDWGLVRLSSSFVRDRVI